MSSRFHDENESETQFITYPREIDTSRSKMQVHQIVRDSTLKVTVDMIRSNLSSHVDDLQVTKVFLFFSCFTISNRLVRSLILLDTSQEVGAGIFSGHPSVVGVAHADFELYIRCDYFRIVTCRFEEKNAQARLLCNASLNFCSIDNRKLGKVWRLSFDDRL